MFDMTHIRPMNKWVMTFVLHVPVLLYFYTNEIILLLLIKIDQTIYTTRKITYSGG